MNKLLVSSALGFSLVVSGCASTGTTLEDLTDAAAVLLESSEGQIGTNEIAEGLKQALTQGSGAVVSQLSRSNGFNNDPRVRIELPESLQKAREIASKFGLQGSFNDLELKLNQAAERATPQAKKLFIGAITNMSIDDAKGILQGPDNAATEYFRNKTGASLETAMRPIIERSLSQVGAVRSLNSLMAKYKTIPLAPEVDADLTGHVVDKGVDGIFLYLAEEEKAIRENPAKRTTELLKRVFGSST